MSRPVRMRDVGKAAGVSVMTVSRVLNGGCPVREALRQKVLQAIEKLDYKRNETARSLRLQRSRSIGLIVPNLPEFAICIQAILSVAAKHMYQVLISTSNGDPHVESEEVDRMLRHHVEGMIIVPSESTRLSGLTEHLRACPVITL